MPAAGAEIIDFISLRTPVFNDFCVEEIIGIVIKIVLKTAPMPVNNGGVAVERNDTRNNFPLLFGKPECNPGITRFEKI